jgi:membrane-associated phospholipid phosphatase
MRAISPGALLACYLAATAVILVLGHDRVYAGGIVVHLLVLAAVLAATFSSRVPPWLQAWTPLIALLFLYTELPMIIRATGHGQFYDATVISWETKIFGAQPALEWARRWPSPALSEVLHAAYLSYYGIIFAVPVALWVARRRAEFQEAVFALMLTFTACFVCYIAFPVQGPRYLWPGTAPDGIIRAAVVGLLESRSSPGTAFPSSHVAVAAAQALLAWRYFGRRGLVIAPLALGLALGAVYGGFHYAIDAIVGAVFGALLALTGLELFVLVSRTADQANATAPTNPRSPDASDSSTSSSGTAST